MHTGDFRSPIFWAILGVRESPFKHGVAAEAIEHAVDNWMFWEDNFNETPNMLILGPDHAGNILEVLEVLAEQVGDDLREQL